MWIDLFHGTLPALKAPTIAPCRLPLLMPPDKKKPAMRRDAGRRLLQIADDLHVADLPPMTEEEIVAEVHTVRAERHARRR